LFSAGQTQRGCGVKTDVEHLRLHRVDLKTGPSAFLREPGKSTLGSVWIATEERDVVGVGQSRQRDCGVSRASSWAEEEAVAVLERPAKHIVDHYDEEEGGQGVTLEDP
jgi:hypothetical protein